MRDIRSRALMLARCHFVAATAATIFGMWAAANDSLIFWGINAVLFVVNAAGTCVAYGIYERMNGGKSQVPVDDSRKLS